MNKTLAISGSAVLVTGLLSGAAVAGGGPTNDTGTTAATATKAAAVGGASAPNARLAAFVNQGGAVNRSKGVAAVTHPSPGLYCIRPSGTLNVNKVVPSVSVDWSTSLGDALMAQWRSSGIGCSAGRIAVLTLDGEDGSFDLSDQVSFTIVVP